MDPGKEFHQSYNFLIEYDWCDRLWVCKVTEQWVTTHGNSPEEAYKNGVEALKIAIESRDEAIALQAKR